MTVQETAKIISVLQAAYPKTIREESPQITKARVALWAAQFAEIPVGVVLLAVQKLVATSKFAPAISEVKDKLHEMYWEAYAIVHAIDFANPATEAQRQWAAQIMAACSTIRSEREPALKTLLTGEIVGLEEGVKKLG